LINKGDIKYEDQDELIDIIKEENILKYNQNKLQTIQSHSYDESEKFSTLKVEERALGTFYARKRSQGNKGIQPTTTLNNSIGDGAFLHNSLPNQN
jgi:hypothetical protein